MSVRRSDHTAAEAAMTQFIHMTLNYLIYDDNLRFDRHPYFYYCQNGIALMLRQVIFLNGYNKHLTMPNGQLN